MSITKYLCTASALIASAAITVGCGGESGTDNNQNRPATTRTASQPPLPSAIGNDKPAHTSPARSVSAPVAERTVAIEPELPDTFSGRIKAGKELHADGDVNEAIDMFEAAIELESKSATPHVEIARVALTGNMLELAREHAELGIELAPESSYAWNTMGRVELAEKDVNAAAASFERAVEENEDNSFAWNNLGLVLMSQGQYDAAVDALEMATGGSTVTSYMWNNLGMCYEHLDEITEARAAYAKSALMGSERARANYDRLEGVDTLIGPEERNAEPDFEIHDTIEKTIEAAPSLELLDAGVNDDSML